MGWGRGFCYEVRGQISVASQTPGLGVLDGKDVRRRGGRASNLQAGGRAGRQAPKNLTCDPGRPHRLKGLRDPEAGSVVRGVPTGPGAG